jgi:hypothetical protein
LRIEQRAADTVDGQPELRSPRSYAEENDGDDDISLF